MGCKRKKDTVDLDNCNKYDEMDVSQRKRKSTDFYFDMTDKKFRANKKSDELLNPQTNEKHVLLRRKLIQVMR